jgi:4-hydroxyphenylpyruvate dioxygenase
MKHAIATVSLSGTLIEKVKAIAKAGYDGLELFENDLLVSNIRPEELQMMLTDLNLELTGLQPFRDYEAMPEPFKSRNLERAKHKFELMHKLGTKKLFICSNTSIHTINSLDKAAEDLYDIAELAKIQGFEIGYEALSWGRFVNTYHQSVDIVRRANHPNLGNILDNFHISVLKSTFEDIYTIPKEKITMVQVADALHYDMSAIHVARHLRCFPGQGSYPVVEFVKAVQATGYDGYLSHEIFNDDFRASDTYSVALDGKRSLVWLNRMTTDLADDLRITVNHNTETVNQIEFVEFASTADRQRPLVEMLENLGFVETHRHRTKDVTLFGLDSIKVVINRQPSDRSENSVCAIGFVTNYKNQLESRAKQLQYEWHDGRGYEVDIINSDQENQQKLDIPLVKGIGGMTYYFIDENQLNGEFYEVEFDSLIQVQSITNNGIVRVDHLGHSVATNLYASNALFYRAFLGLDVEESLEILDPRGIVYSRVAKNKAGTIRISLSSTRSIGTATEQFTTRKGSGIQQIAFESTDIFTTAQSIKNKELILQIPTNYYDDLRAKTQLSEAVIDQMQQHHILYDCQADGEFFHFYFKELNGLFFEVVQRKAIYNRYGEINAQVRLAAQERSRKVVSNE